MIRNIWAQVHTAKAEDETVYGISFPDFPGVASGGASPEEAVERGRATLAFHIAGMVEDKEPLPALRPLDELLPDGNARDDVRNEGPAFVQIPVEIPSKMVRINISIDEELLAAIDRAASATGKTCSGFIAEAAQTYLRRTQ